MHSEFVNEMWNRSGGGVGFISSLNRNSGQWADVPYGWDDPAEFEQEEGHDIFFTPLTYEKPRRLAHLHMPPSILFADLDPVDPRGLDILPQAAWETSPGSYQAIWLLANPIKYRTKWAELNRRMTYHTKADKGGWAGSKVLRVPGTLNYKREGEPGKMLWWSPDMPEYAVGWLDDMLIPASEIQVEGEVGDAPAIIADRKQLDLLWKTLPPRMQWELNNKRVPDRSRHIVRLAHMMKETGVPIETAFHMLWYAPFNKWRPRNNPQRLWVELSNVYDR